MLNMSVGTIAREDHEVNPGRVQNVINSGQMHLAPLLPRLALNSAYLALAVIRIQKFPDLLKVSSRGGSSSEPSRQRFG